MIFKLKTVVYAVRLVTFLILRRKFGKIIHDIASNHADELTIPDLRKFEKLCIKLKKAELDINFMNNCKTLNVIPKFLSFNIPHANSIDTRNIRKRLLKSAIKRRADEKSKLCEHRDEATIKIRNIVTSLEWYILNQAVRKNVDKEVEKAVKIHTKKLEKLTKNEIIPFSPEEVITNLSEVILTNEEKELLKNGLDYALPPRNIIKTDIFTQFEMIHRLLTQDITNEEDKAELRTEISQLAFNYYNSYSPSKSTLKKHGILKRLRSNKDIVIVKPDKGNGVIILDRGDYDKKLFEIINDSTKFKKLKKDETVSRQNSLQRFLRTLKKDGFF